MRARAYTLAQANFEMKKSAFVVSLEKFVNSACVSLKNRRNFIDRGRRIQVQRTTAAVQLWS